MAKSPGDKNWIENATESLFTISVNINYSSGKLNTSSPICIHVWLIVSSAYQTHTYLVNYQLWDIVIIK